MFSLTQQPKGQQDRTCEKGPGCWLTVSFAPRDPRRLEDAEELPCQFVSAAAVPGALAFNPGSLAPDRSGCM